jgi:hypothetical protein
MEPLDSPLPHPFDNEVNFLVLEAYAATLDGILRLQSGATARIQADSSGEVETLPAILEYSDNWFDDLRGFARQFALVELVTRFQHWIRKIETDAKKLTNKRIKRDKTKSVHINSILYLHMSLGLPVCPYQIPRLSRHHGEIQIGNVGSAVYEDTRTPTSGFVPRASSEI